MGESTSKRVPSASRNDDETADVPRRTRQQRSEAPGEASPRQRRQARERRGNASEKTVYNVRRSSDNKRKRTIEIDDPPVSSGLWPDMDTFRGLLRNEAELRLKILGDDWADVVKEEADWRHDLYKNWLWTLHRGVGEPFVESRSDRARRRRPPPPSGSRTTRAEAPPSKSRRRVRDR